MGPQPLHCTRAPSESDVHFDADNQESPVASETDGGSVVSDLIAIVAHLQLVSGVAVALDLALRRQNAEKDIELADCLRLGVIGSTAQELERARRLVERLGGRLPESPL